MIMLIVIIACGFVLYSKSTHLPITENRQAFKKSGLWGYKNSEGEIVIPVQYDSAKSFQNGYAVVTKNSKLGTIGIDGKVLSPIMIDKIGDEISGTNVRVIFVGNKKSLLMPNGKLLFDPTNASFKNDDNRYRRPSRFKPLGVTAEDRIIVIGENAKILFDNDKSSGLLFDFKGRFSVSILDGGKKYAAIYSQNGELIFKSDEFDSIKVSNYKRDGDFLIVEKSGLSNLYNKTTDAVLLPWGKGEINAAQNGYARKEAIHRDGDKSDVLGDKSDVLYSFDGKVIASHYDINNIARNGLRRIQCSKDSQIGLMNDFGRKVIPCLADHINWDYEDKVVEIGGESYVFEDEVGRKFSDADEFILDLSKRTCLKGNKSGYDPDSPRHVSSEYVNTMLEMGCVTAEIYNTDYSGGSFSIKITNENSYYVRVEASVLSTVYEGRYGPDELYCKKHLSDQVIWMKPNDTEIAYFSGGCKQQIGWLRRYGFVGSNILKVERMDESEFNAAKSRPTSTASGQSSNSQTQCSRFASLTFRSDGLTENPVSLQVVSSKNVSINRDFNDSASLSALSGDCVGGEYRYSFVVNTGLRQESQKQYQGSVSIPNNAENCSVNVSDGYAGVNCY